ncbi:MAG: tetratricopeptide repeat protein [Hyphomicrobium sp.]
MFHLVIHIIKGLLVLYLLLVSRISFAEKAPYPPTSEGNISLDTNVNKSSHLLSLRTLYDELAKAPDDTTAERITIAIEKLWIKSGSSTADLILERAILAANARDFENSIFFLNRAIELYPDWPEAYNRRAYLYVLRQDYLLAQADLRRVLSLDAQNFRALEGLVQVLSALGQKKAALETSRELVKIHPFSPGAKETLLKLESEAKN